jgi:hypothetical protein
MVRELEDGSEHSFGDWPPSHFEVGPTGVYTIWRGADFLGSSRLCVGRCEFGPVR